MVRFNFVLHYCLSKFINKLNVLSQRLNYNDSLHDNENMVLIKQEYLVVCVIKELAFKEEKHSQQDELVVYVARKLHQSFSKSI